MQFSDAEISLRMDLLNLTSAELHRLASCQPLIESRIEQIVDAFYQAQLKVDEISLLIGDADTLRRLRNAQRSYILTLFGGSYDSDYVNNRLRIGMVHKRIGVEPKLYLSAIRSLKLILIDNLSELVEDPDECHRLLDTLDKLIYFDTTLVVDTYIDCLLEEINTAKNRTEIYARSLEEKVAERTRELEAQAKIDPLTNIFNRRVLQELLHRELANAERRGTSLCLIYFDVDDFKSINDNEGHHKGDEVLVSIGRILQQELREGDVACRYGGDEFCMLLPDCDLVGAKAVCDKVWQAFSAEYPDWSLSMGIAQNTMGCDEAYLVKQADKKMYQAKKTAGFKVCW